MSPSESRETSRAWDSALREHDAALSAFAASVIQLPETGWHVAPASGKWSPADEVLHVVLSYEVALVGVRTGAGMRPRVSPLRARILRWLVLPLIINTQWFPRAKAPAEIRPPAGSIADADLSPAALRTRLQLRAQEVREELPRVRSGLRFRHAYFGDLSPRQAMRMLAAHTRHHARTLGARSR